MLLKDARTYQIAFLSLFLILGVATRDWTLRPEMLLVTIATCLTTQAIATLLSQHVSINQRPSDPASALPAPSPYLLITSSLPSALITSLGLSLLLRADHYSTMILAAVAAILSKFLLRVNTKHIFNPANFGMIVALLLTNDAWVSPGQWGESGWYVLLFLGCGGLVLQKVGRWDTTVAFLGSYALLEAARNLWLGWTWDVWAHRLMSGSLLLFALFMVTDPRSIPNARMGRLVWAIAIAILTFWLRNHQFVSTAVLWALFVLTPLIVILDAIWQAPRFTWQPPATTNPTLITEN
ncbi:RnfABCDGE type electron transport complex subunit D [Pantanalinema sp. GBBB05]|uniref:RnfABCDGE type electron transport complex subunit D n=1 Tax=Pantanalinema sp. GBBB05 TaxID=2604139 RepID=UPI001D7163B5|nr:Na+-transporting NADH:ubiquinone oxidoreductase, subunit NqrB [Pantanalinema sp. GBBB05]